MRQRHSHHGKRMQEVYAIGDIGKSLRIELLLGITDVLQDIFTVCAHKDSRRAADTGQSHKVVMATGKVM